jgi:maltooligosyltrehalose trehalohydrolase
MSAGADGPLGATYLRGGRTRFRVWAPRAKRVELRLLASQERVAALEKRQRGYHEAVVEGVEPGALYWYVLDGKKERADPASRSQPEGVHGPSQVVDIPDTTKGGSWRGLPLERLVFYELHVGTFTPEGTFDAVIPHLDQLKELGVTTIELMPVAQFPGERNWGYDGVFPFAAQNSYGGPAGLRRLVDACHQRGLAAVLDVVYNHLGPEGNCLVDFGPYFSERERTPWGAALNFDGPHHQEVRRYFIENALLWLADFGFDALRLDSIHAIHDQSARPFLAELAAAVRARARELGRPLYLIPESLLNEVRPVEAPERGGFGHDAQWNDDFHHALHALLTGERVGCYQDFGQVAHLAKAFREGFVLSGQFSAFRGRKHSVSSRAVAAHRFVVYAQNHDQVGNRPGGDRLSQSLSFEALKLAAGVTLLSPFLPLLFMGEEYGETAPFLFFTSHSDPRVAEAAREGREREAVEFGWEERIADPQAEATFRSSKLNHALRRQGKHKRLREFYRELLRLRRELPALAHLSKENQQVIADEERRLLLVRRWHGSQHALLAANFSEAAATARVSVRAGTWRKRLDSADERWGGAGARAPETLESSGEMALPLAPWSVALLVSDA